MKMKPVLCTNFMQTVLNCFQTSDTGSSRIQVCYVATHITQEENVVGQVWLVSYFISSLCQCLFCIIVACNQPNQINELQLDCHRGLFILWFDLYHSNALQVCKVIFQSSTTDILLAYINDINMTKSQLQIQQCK